MLCQSLEYVTSLWLDHDGDCRLLGVGPHLTIYAQVLYGDEDWLAQYGLSLDGRMIAAFDENYGAKSIHTPLALPTGSIRPNAVRHTKALNFSGPRLRGLRETERIAEAVRPLALQTKIALTERLKLPIPPPMLLGLAESRVLAEALLAPPNLWLVCRRLRLAYLLPQAQYDVARQPYDYDTVMLHVIHEFVPKLEDDELMPEQLFTTLPGVELQHPMDCMIHEGQLYVAEGGQQTHAAVHVWRIQPAV